MLDARISQAKRVLLWLLVAALAALVTYYAFRGYLNAGLLLNFANLLSC